ncbi:MAG: cyclase family protein [Nitrospinota bacterium]
MASFEIDALTRGSTAYDLGVELFPGMPHIPHHGPFTYSLIREHGDMPYPGGACSAVDVFACTGHTGTHIDALGHFTKEMRLHGGLDVRENQSKTGGLRRCGVEEVGPIVRRAVMLDVAAYLKEERLGPGQAVGPRELEETARWANVEPRAGDVALIRTGHMQLWPKKDYYLQQGGAPGISLEAAQWLSGAEVFMVGSDNFAVELTPSPNLPVHVHMLVERGIHLLEVVNLEELSAKKVYEFLLVALPLKIRGGTGSPVRPVAIV